MNIKNIIKNQMGQELYENILEIIRECRNEGVQKAAVETIPSFGIEGTEKYHKRLIKF